MLRLWFIITAIISASEFVSADTNWELAAAVTDNIDFIDKTGEIFEKFAVKDGLVTSLAFDPIYSKMYFTNNHSEYSVFQLDPFNHSNDYKPIVLKQSEGDIQNLAFDTISQTLYWTVKNKIKYLMVDNKDHHPSYGIDLYSFSDGFQPYDLTVDTCNRMLYWTNQFEKRYSFVQKSKLVTRDNTKEKWYSTLYNDSVIAYGIVIDHSSNRVYWSEEGDGSHMFIKSLSLLRENDVEKPKPEFEDTKGHSPTSLTRVDSQFFWTDSHKQFYTFEMINERPTVRSLHKHNRTSNARVFSLISMKQSSYIINLDDCKNIHAQKKQETKQNPDCQGGSEQSVLENGEKVIVCSHSSKTGPTVKNTHLQDHSGTLDVDVCFNYCLNDGQCSVTGSNPKCYCKKNWGGERCEIDLCGNYCQNGGICYFENGNKKCSCNDGYKGDFCEQHVLIEQYMCIAHCSLMSVGYDDDSAMEIFSSHKIPIVKRSSCSCSDYSIKKHISKTTNDDDSLSNNKTTNLLTASSMNSSSEIYECTWNDSWIFAIICGFGIVCLLLMACIAVLINKVMALRKRPRIKKRIIVNKNVTPLTSRPQTTEQCEITIENCCNMNICETPCFEPEFRKPPSKEKSKNEEKKSLLTSIDLPPDDLY